jgi:hypothetical protein
MSDESRTPYTKIGPQVIGIVAAAAILVAAMRTDRVPDDAGSPLHRGAHNLRVGMPSAESFAAMQIPVGLSRVLDGPLTHLDVGYYDPQRSEWLWLSFDGDISAGGHQFHYRLTKWAFHR